MLGINLSQSAAARITSADELTATIADAAVETFVARLGDQIDDRVAEAFDEQLAARMEQPGPLRSAVTRDRRPGLVVLASMLLGTLATILTNGIAMAALTWVGLAVINVAYLSRQH